MRVGAARPRTRTCRRSNRRGIAWRVVLTLSLSGARVIRMARRARYGPEPKGDRDHFNFRLPKSDLAHYRAEAERAGLPLSDYLAWKLAEAHGLPAPAYVTRSRRQEVLDVA